MVQKHSEKVKGQALKALKEHGLAEVHRETGVPKSTLLAWRNKAGIKPIGTAQTKAAAETNKATNALRREGRKEKLQDRIDELLDRMVEKQIDFKGQMATKVEYPFPPAQDVKALAYAVAILLDKYRLECGEAPPTVSKTDDGEDPKAQMLRYVLALKANGTVEEAFAAGEQCDN